MKTTFLPAFRLLLVLTVLTGVLYPLGMTLLTQIIFPYQSNGSLIQKNGTVIGSELIGQQITGDKYFHPRPSAIDYAPMPSSGTNWGPTDRRMRDSVIARSSRFIALNHLPAGTIVPKEMLFASGSGVDPHISPEAARMQIERIAAVRGFTKEQTAAVKKIVEKLSEGPQLQLFGDPRVNVLKLNIALDGL
ncbi:MAG: potassium-transporting ATPase subunit KdpC [Bacteroidota bacterium]